MAIEVKSGATSDILTVDPTSKAARVTLYNTDGSPIIPAGDPPTYMATTAGMTLATLAANSCILSIDNPALSAKTYYFIRLFLTTSFSGTAAATYVPFSMSRGTGTSAGGTANKTAAAIGKRDTTVANSTATFRYGPSAVTGMTDDSAGDLCCGVIGHQVGQNAFYEFIPTCIRTNEYLRNGLKVVAGTSLTVRNRLISVAGTIVTISAIWMEV